MLIALLALSGLAAARPLPGMHAPVEATLSVSLDRRADGTAQLMVDPGTAGAFAFDTPTGWYPVVFPLTAEEARRLNEALASANVPLNIGDEQLADQSSLTASGLWMAVFSLNPAHFEGGYGAAVLGAVLDVPSFSPDWSVVLLKMFEPLNVVQRMDILKIDNQYLADIAFVLDLPEDAGVLHCNALVFVRNGNLFVLFGATPQIENLTALTTAISAMRNSLNFQPTP